MEEDCRRSLPLDGDGRQTVEKDARAAEYSAVRRCIVPGVGKAAEASNSGTGSKAEPGMPRN